MRNIRRGRMVKTQRREEAIERAKNYKPSDNPIGLREKVRRGLISIYEAISLASDYNEDIRGWLQRKKIGNFKSADQAKKIKKGKKKKKNAKKNKKNS